MPQRTHVPSTIESGETSGARRDDEGDLAHPEHRDPLQAAPAGIRQQGRGECENGGDDDEADVVLNDHRNGLDHVRDAGGAVDAEIRHDRAGERQRIAADTRHGSGGEDTGERLERPPRAPAGRLHRERQERDRADAAEHRPRHEEQARPRVAPEHGEPRDGERGVRDGGRLGDVAEREDRYEEGDREADRAAS